MIIIRVAGGKKQISDNIDSDRQGCSIHIWTYAHTYSWNLDKKNFFNWVHPSKGKTSCPLLVNIVFTIVLPHLLLYVKENSRDG